MADDIGIPATMPGLDEAAKQLDAMISADATVGDAAIAPAADLAPAPASAIIEPGRAAQAGADATATPDTDKTDTQAAADSTTDTSDGKHDVNDKGSKFAKDYARRENSWKELNRQKDEFKVQQSEFRAERERVAMERQEWQRRRDQMDAKYSPEEYDAAAERWENDGEYKLAELARDRAKELRDSPTREQTLKTQAEDRQKAEKEWYSKAAIDFPDTAKSGSEQNTKLKAFISSEPGVLQDPKGMYYASRLVNAETTATRVPVLEKELGELRAKVKELESTSLPSGQGSPTGMPSDSDANQYADLERMARDMVSIR